ncbi:YqhA family protein [Pseudogulbenkiania subflava]|uniref:TIGR00645 family protein n=1 Tax=Pseudogulbenkiania subflava DSM 22618 TaxID=1123014 RepID=A0A1Y6B765_9NEIS|nr:YqhA family protein [Pseudogulbenkiania subflava]SME96612.1 TIGR00645 family protein [Pseudogulbenkiania subflava DSM 22618]
MWELPHNLPVLTETEIMLSVLALIDVVMIPNLLLMVTVGGYETFVSAAAIAYTDKLQYSTVHSNKH